MTTLKVQGNAAGSGTVTITPPNTSSTRTLTLPDADLTIPATNSSTTLTTQGDILYRDGSGIQRLAKGTAGQVLKMNSGATAPEWGTDVGGKVLAFKYTTTQIAYGDGNWAWPTTETDLSGHSISMTKQSSGTSYYLFTLSSNIHYGSGSIDGRFYIYKGSSLLGDQSTEAGTGYIHSPTASVNEHFTQRMVTTSASDTYKLRIKAGSTNLQLARGGFTTFSIMEFE